MNGSTRRILVLANETAESAALQDAVRERARRPGVTEVLVVAPALNTKVRHWLSDEDGAREAARRRLRACLERLSGAGVQAEGLIGDADPLQAIEDTLRLFPADELVVATHPRRRSHWLARDLPGRARARHRLPVVHIVVEEVAEPVRHAA